MEPVMTEPERLGVILLSGCFDRIHYGLAMASAAAALGRPVTLFATVAATRAFVARGPDGTADPVADPQAEAADLARADVDVVRARQQAVSAHEAEALVDDVEDAGRIGMAGALGLAFEDPLDEVVLALLGTGLELEIAADLAELGDAHLAKIGDVEVVPLAGGLELLHLVVFGDRRARGHLGPAARPAVPLTLVGTELGHERGVPSGIGRWPGLVIARNRSAAQAGLGWTEHSPRKWARQQNPTGPIRPAGGRPRRGGRAAHMSACISDVRLLRSPA